MKPDQNSISVVLVGTFEPVRFLLEELQRVEALGKSDIASAKYLSLLANQIVEIKLGNWGKLSVTDEILSVEVSEAPFIRAADLVLKCVRELAPNSIVRKLGINVKSWYAYQDPKVRDAFGTRISEPSHWGNWGKQIAENLSLPATDPKHGGLVSATLRQGMPDDRESGHIDVRIDSAAVNAPVGVVFGVQILVNDHYEPSAATASSETERVHTVKLLEALEKRFDESIRRSMDISDDVISGGSK